MTESDGKITITVDRGLYPKASRYSPEVLKDILFELAELHRVEPTVNNLTMMLNLLESDLE